MSAHTSFCTLGGVATYAKSSQPLGFTSKGPAFAYGRHGMSRSTVAAANRNFASANNERSWGVPHFSGGPNQQHKQQQLQGQGQVEADSPTSRGTGPNRSRHKSDSKYGIDTSQMAVARPADQRGAYGISIGANKHITSEVQVPGQEGRPPSRVATAAVRAPRDRLPSSHRPPSLASSTATTAISGNTFIDRNSQDDGRGFRGSSDGGDAQLRSMIREAIEGALRTEGKLAQEAVVRTPPKLGGGGGKAIGRVTFMVSPVEVAQEVLDQAECDAMELSRRTLHPALDQVQGRRLESLDILGLGSGFGGGGGDGNLHIGDPDGRCWEVGAPLSGEPGAYSGSGGAVRGKFLYDFRDEEVAQTQAQAGAPELRTRMAAQKYRFLLVAEQGGPEPTREHSPSQSEAAYASSAVASAPLSSRPKQPSLQLPSSPQHQERQHNHFEPSTPQNALQWQQMQPQATSAPRSKGQGQWAGRPGEQQQRPGWQGIHEKQWRDGAEGSGDERDMEAGMGEDGPIFRRQRYDYRLRLDPAKSIGGMAGALVQALSRHVVVLSEVVGSDDLYHAVKVVAMARIFLKQQQPQQGVAGLRGESVGSEGARRNVHSSGNGQRGRQKAKPPRQQGHQLLYASDVQSEEWRPTDDLALQILLPKQPYIQPRGYDNDAGGGQSSGGGEQCIWRLYSHRVPTTQKGDEQVEPPLRLHVSRTSDVRDVAGKLGPAVLQDGQVALQAAGRDAVALALAAVVRTRSWLASGAAQATSRPGPRSAAGLRLLQARTSVPVVPSMSQPEDDLDVVVYLTWRGVEGRMGECLAGREGQVEGLSVADKTGGSAGGGAVGDMFRAMELLVRLCRGSRPDLPVLGTDELRPPIS